jgi:hypothetical protein
LASRYSRSLELRDIKIRAQVIALKRLAQETAEIYDELIRCKTPPQLVRGYFLVSMLRERIVEERRGERLRSAALESFTRMPTRRPSTNYRILTGGHPHFGCNRALRSGYLIGVLANYEPAKAVCQQILDKTTFRKF